MIARFQFAGPIDMDWIEWEKSQRDGQAVRMQVSTGTIPSTNRSVKDLVKVIFIDIDNTLLSFTGYVKDAMREGFNYFGLKPYTETMFPVFERINNSLWR